MNSTRLPPFLDNHKAKAVDSLVPVRHGRRELTRPGIKATVNHDPHFHFQQLSGDHARHAAHAARSSKEESKVLKNGVKEASKVSQKASCRRLVDGSISAVA